MRILFCLLLALVCSGCVLHSKAGTSFDGLGTQYEARPLAERTAQEIRQRYSPARTTIALDRTEGPFGDSLEQALRTQGFAVGSSGTAISYTVDVYEDGTPPIGYVQLRLPEGQFLSFSYELEAPIWSTVNPTPVVEPSPLAENDLPPASTMPVVGHVPTPPANQASAERTMAAPAASATPLPVHTVHHTATATQVAKRNNIPVAAFCRWNDVSPSQTLPTGYRVHLRQPAHTPTPEFIPIVQSAPSPPPQNTAPVASATATIPNSQPLLQPVPAVQQEILPSPNQDIRQHDADAKDEISPASVPNSAPTWLITPGNLQAQVSAWAARGNYQLIWKTQNDFEMETQASFQGDFMDAIRQLFMGLQRSGHALRVTLYQGNNVLEVSEE